MRESSLLTLPSVLTSCRFCAIADRPGQGAAHDRPFLADQQYFAIASIGALVDGWSLVCTKEHSLNLSLHYGDANFLGFVRKVARLVEQNYGGTSVIFEHGVGYAGSPTGCGTDHAHVHVVPFDDSLEQKLRSENEGWISLPLDKARSVCGDGEYLLYCGNVLEANSAALVRPLSQPISQFFRKMIAATIGRAADCNYRDFPYFERASKAASILRRVATAPV
jgi:diadenosine tetraphosphate (Ap4A) HIT family hydrolase